MKHKIGKHGTIGIVGKDKDTCVECGLGFPKPKKVKKLSLKGAKAKAWKAFSLWVRQSAVIAFPDMFGDIPCYTCGQWKPCKQMQAGHGIAGRNNAILFDERIVKPQCVGCNIFGRGKQAIFTYKLIQELGMSVYEGILHESQDAVQYKVADYISIEEKYKKKLEDLNRED